MSNITKALAVAGVATIQVTIPPEAIAARDAAVSKAKEIKAVASKDDVELAIARISVLKGLAKGVEDVRKELTAPLLAGQRDLKAKADEFALEPNAEVKRLEGLVSAFHSEEQRKAREERQRIEAEQLKAAQAQAELARAQRQREQAAQRAAELEKQAAEAKKAADRKRLAQEAETARQEEQAAEIAIDEIAFEMPETPAAPAVLPEIDKGVAGASVRGDVLEIEITDLKALIEFAISKDRLADFFKLEPRIKNIKDYIDFHNGGRAIPGLLAERKVKVNARAANATLSLQG